jgi:hypothetical protein
MSNYQNVNSFDGLPIRLNHSVRDNFVKSPEAQMMHHHKRVISGNVIYDIVIDDGCEFIHPRNKDWDPVTFNDEKMISG